MRFDRQPGVILADEVGMGKTFVALAVAASVVEANSYSKPVLVMVPSAVKDKWPREWGVFREFCLKPEGPEIRAMETSAHRGSDLLKLLDDPPDKQAHIIFVTHGALTSSLSDPLVRMAIVRRVLMRPSLAAQRRVFPRRAAGVMRGGRAWWREDFVSMLLEANPREWKRIYNRYWPKPLDDDPVPEALLESLRRVDLDPLADALRDLPLRAGSRLQQRLTRVRRAIDEGVDEVWRECLHRLDLELPLLILDEAHHTRNPGTRLAQLFSDRSAERDVEALAGPLHGVFDRMLFLTATPFQLAHSELIEVLRRFEAVRWNHGLDRDAYVTQIRRLSTALDDTKTASLRFDDAWGRLDPSELHEHGDDRWWDGADQDQQLPQSIRRAADRFRRLRERNREAQRLLRPLVIRHTRPDRDERRLYLDGAAIRKDHPDGRTGLQVKGAAVLPFLLAARTQAIVLTEARQRGRQARAHFAEGLASSFEAYRVTRSGADEGKDEDATVVPHEDLSQTAGWYLTEVDRALPSDTASIWSRHPKVAATVEQSVRLWEGGDKTLIFCFYIATGRALRKHISSRLARSIVRMGAEKFGCKPSDREYVLEQLRLFGDRFQDPTSPVARETQSALRQLLGPCGLQTQDLDDAVDVVRRFLRTPAFLVRYVELGSDRADAVVNAIEATTASGMKLRERIIGFGEFLESRASAERAELLHVLRDIPTGSVFADPEHFDASEGAGESDRLPNVRLANGQVRRETRRRLLLTFNTPFYPEILIASSVMGEGVDLQHNCRHVIHHDLDWNPSVLEQRTGRVDRLGSLAERSGQKIRVYEPFIEATQDEKLFRVVKDRERWFNFVMGHSLKLDEWSTDQLAERAELPAEIADELTMDLSVLKNSR